MREDKDMDLNSTKEAESSLLGDRKRGSAGQKPRGYHRFGGKLWDQDSRKRRMSEQTPLDLRNPRRMLWSPITQR